MDLLPLDLGVLGNLAEQAGLNDGLGQFLHTQGIGVELKGAPDRFISLTAQSGTQYIDF